MKESKKKAYEMREDFKKFIKGETSMPNYSEEEEEALENWCQMLAINLSKASEKSLRKFVRKTGHAEAFLLGLARFTCTIIQNMENEGLSTKGGNVWDYYYLAILPTAHDIEVEHQRESHPNPEVVIALMDTSISIRQIFDKFFSYVPDEYREECMKEIQEERNKLLNYVFGNSKQ